MLLEVVILFLNMAFATAHMNIASEDDKDHIFVMLGYVCIQNIVVNIGWSSKSANVQGFGEHPSAKAQIFNLIHSIRTVVRIPLIFLNIVTMLIKLILG